MSTGEESQAARRPESGQRGASAAGDESVWRWAAITGAVAAICIAGAALIIAVRADRGEEAEAQLAPLQTSFADLEATVRSVEEHLEQQNVDGLRGEVEALSAQLGRLKEREILTALSASLTDAGPFSHHLAEARRLMEDRPELAVVLDYLQGSADTGIPTAQQLRAEFPRPPVSSLVASGNGGADLFDGAIRLNVERWAETASVWMDGPRREVDRTIGQAATWIKKDLSGEVVRLKSRFEKMADETVAVVSDTAGQLRVKDPWAASDQMMESDTAAAANEAAPSTGSSEQPPSAAMSADPDATTTVDPQASTSSSDQAEGGDAASVSVTATQPPTTEAPTTEAPTTEATTTEVTTTELATADKAAPSSDAPEPPSDATASAGSAANAASEGQDLSSERAVPQPTDAERRLMAWTQAWDRVQAHDLEGALRALRQYAGSWDDDEVISPWIRQAQARVWADRARASIAEIVRDIDVD